MKGMKQQDLIKAHRRGNLRTSSVGRTSLKFKHPISFREDAKREPLQKLAAQILVTFQKMEPINCRGAIGTNKLPRELHLKIEKIAGNNLRRNLG